MAMAQMETMAIDEQPTSAAPRIAAAAAPHKQASKRQAAVAAGKKGRWRSRWSGREATGSE
eukprot:7007267-Prymnesium_polylepis.1